MKKVAIITDSVAAIPREIAEKYEITIVPFHAIVDGKDYPDMGVDMRWLYNRLKEKDKHLPTTSCPSEGEFLQAYSRLAQNLEAILYISMTSAFSKGYHAAVEAQEIAREKLPKTRIEIIDSYTVEAGEIPIVIEAAKAAKEDKDHPRKAVVRALIHRGAKVVTTEGSDLRTSHNAPDRDGWTAAVPLEYPEDQEAQ